VARALAAGSPPGPEVALDLGALEASTLGRIAEERGFVASLRALPRAPRIALLALATVAGGLFYFATTRRPDWDAYPPARMWLALGSFAGVGLALAWVSLRPLYLRPLSDTTRRILLGAALVLPFALSLLPEVDTGFKLPARVNHAMLTYYCNIMGASLGLVLYVLARAVDRGGHASGATSQLAAVGAGLIGILAVQIHCPVNDLPHLTSGHATIPLVLLGATLLVRKL
jgi:hypothetical protein